MSVSSFPVGPDSPERAAQPKRAVAVVALRNLSIVEAAFGRAVASTLLSSVEERLLGFAQGRRLEVELCAPAEWRLIECGSNALRGIGKLAEDLVNLLTKPVTGAGYAVLPAISLVSPDQLGSGLLWLPPVMQEGF